MIRKGWLFLIWEKVKQVCIVNTGIEVNGAKSFL